MKIITFNDALYPPLLREIYQSPKKLFVLGNPEILAQPQIAVVGSRRPTPAGLEIAHQFAFDLASAGVIVTSGLALGIDGAAHRGCLAAQKPTVAVLACGLDIIYPPSHQSLAGEILAAGGALVSEWAPGTRPLAAYFPQRNRIVTGLSLGVLVVEAGLKSGSLISARLAMEQNRDVFAVPGALYNPQAAGCHLLIGQGAKLVTAASELVAEYQDRLPRQRPASQETAPELLSKLDSDQRMLLECVDFSPTPVDIILKRCGLKSGQFSTMLLSLEIKGYINKVTAGYIRVTHPEASRAVGHNEHKRLL